MQVFHSLDTFSKLENAVVTIGSFDGVHIGHQQLLRKLCSVAQETYGNSVVVTFEPHPQEVLCKIPDFFTILTQEEKIKLIERENIDVLILLPFTKTLAALTSEQFVQEILIDRIGTRTLIMGPDNHFGKDRSDFYTLQKFLLEKGITPIQIEEYLLNDIAVRSTKIRQAIKQKNYHEAELLLGHSTFYKQDLH